MEIKNGYYAIYHNNEYSLFHGHMENRQNVLLLSHDRNDIDNGFKLSCSEEYMQQHNFFTCEKEVPKSEITEAYAIRTYANYRGLKDYRGFRLCVEQELNNAVQLFTEWEVGHCDYRTQDMLKKDGFMPREGDKLGYTYAKYVPIDDPELELIEERTELDISNWCSG